MPNIPISSLPLTTSVCATALVPIVQNGVTCSTYACLLGGGGGGGGNVNCLIAGNGINISPSCGIGNVTINATSFGGITCFVGGAGICVTPSCGYGDVTITKCSDTSTMQRGGGTCSIYGNGFNNITCGSYSFIGGGENNCITNCGSNSFIGGGCNNCINGSAGSAILGGLSNCIQAQNTGAFGCGLCGCYDGTFYVNNLCVCGNIFDVYFPNGCAICVSSSGLTPYAGSGSAGVLCTSGSCSTIRDGLNNTASGFNSFVTGQFNTPCGNYNTIINGCCNTDNGLDNVIVINLNSFTTPQQCTTYVNCLSVRNISQNNYVCVGANNILVAPTLASIYENSCGICSLGRTSTNAFAFGDYSASFKTYSCVYGNLSTSFGCNFGFPSIVGAWSYNASSKSCISGDLSYIGGGICSCSYGWNNTIMAGYNNQTCCGNNNATGGGTGNLNFGFNNAIAGGNYNRTFGCNNFIGTGCSNWAGFSGVGNLDCAKNNTILSGQLVRQFAYSQHSNNSILTGFCHSQSGNFGVSMSGLYYCYAGNYTYMAMGEPSSRLCPANFNTSIIASGNNQYCDYNFSGVSISGGLYGCYASGIISANSSFLSSDFGFMGVGRMSLSASGLCFNTALSGAVSGVSCSYTEVNNGFYSCVCASYSTMDNAPYSCITTGSLYSYTFGSCNTTMNNSGHTFILGNNNFICNGLGITAMVGCGLCNTTGCSFMSNKLVACNIFGAGSLCANANGLISPVVSDIRIKCNIQPLDYGIEDLKKLNPVSYKWSDLYKETKGLSRKLGFIAQEVEKIIPEAVNNKNEVYIFDDKALIPLLTKSIQNISHRIQVLNNGLDLILEKS